MDVKNHAQVTANVERQTCIAPLYVNAKVLAAIRMILYNVLTVSVCIVHIGYIYGKLYIQLYISSRCSLIIFLTFSIYKFNLFLQCT